jgi:hypothetical protein
MMAMVALFTLIEIEVPVRSTGYKQRAVWKKAMSAAEHIRFRRAWVCERKRPAVEEPRMIDFRGSGPGIIGIVLISTEVQDVARVQQGRVHREDFRIGNYDTPPHCCPPCLTCGR